MLAHPQTRRLELCFFPRYTLCVTHWRPERVCVASVSRRRHNTCTCRHPIGVVVVVDGCDVVCKRVCAVDGCSVGRPFGWSSVALEDVLHIICQLLEPIYNQTLGMFTHSCTPHTHAYSEADICADHVPMSGRVRRARTEKDIIGHMHLVG